MLPGSQEIPLAQQKAMVRANEDPWRWRLHSHTPRTEAGLLTALQVASGSRDTATGVQEAEDTSAQLGLVPFTNLGMIHGKLNGKVPTYSPHKAGLPWWSTG